MNLDDLIKRIQDDAIKAGMPPNIAASIGNTQRGWKDFDERAGHRRFEIKVSAGKAVSFIKKLFKKGETK